MITKEIKLYEYSELSDKAKEEVKIRESLREKSDLSKVAPKKKKESKEINR